MCGGFSLKGDIRLSTEKMASLPQREMYDSGLVTIEL